MSNALPAGWRVLHDVRRLGGRLTNVDRVLVGPTGVFVVVRDLRPHVDVIAATAEAAVDVAGRVPGLDPRHVVPVLCVDRDVPATGRFHDVLVCRKADLVDLVTRREKVLEPVRVDSVVGRLRHAAPVPIAYATSVRRAPRPKVQHQPWTPGAQASPAVRAALIAIAVVLVLCPLIALLVDPVADRLVTFVWSLF
jgi:hypothetical protein